MKVNWKNEEKRKNMMNEWNELSNRGRTGLVLSVSVIGVMLIADLLWYQNSLINSETLSLAEHRLRLLEEKVDRIK